MLAKSFRPLGETLLLFTEEASENQPLQPLKSLQGYRYHYTDMTMD